MIRNLVAVLAIVALAPLSASAAPIVLYDASITTAGGWYNGAGNPNGGFTIVKDNGVEIALRAKQRQDPNVIHTANNIYDVLAGPQQANGGNANRAWWNYEFGFDLSAANLLLTDVTTEFTVSDLTEGKSGTVDMKAHWFDNATYGPGGEGLGPATYATSWSAQQSQNPEFSEFPPKMDAPYAFDKFAEHYYRVSLGIKDLAGNLLALNFIDIRVGDAEAPAPVPEPGTIILSLAGLGFIAAARRRQKKQSK